MDQNTKDILAGVNFIKDKMVTKDELPDLVRPILREEVRVIVREELRDLRSDVKAIRTELDELKEKVDNITGYRKEIDYALERIAAIEKHLGINKKIAA
jgi:surfactin synthase thioesterase subunit